MKALLTRGAAAAAAALFVCTTLPDALAQKAAAKEPGIWAHQHIGAHSDGAFPVFVCALMDAGHDAEEAYCAAVALATGTRKWAQMPKVT